ncbi:MAG: 4Fe-4S binding protein [Dehalococcoidales bacterium]|nr:4Fe-4S binding protein [Dehalococcoidales bacterium]
MLANYGFKDGSGDWFLAIDTEKCDGCGDCVPVCPASALEVGEDEYDPFRDEPVAKVKAEHRKKIRYSCAPCQPGYGEKLPPCIAACKPGAISHSDGWKVAYSR